VTTFGTTLREAEVERLSDLMTTAVTEGRAIDRPLAADLAMADAYRIAAAVAARRQRSGDRRAGRKFGFTNRSIWARYGVDTAMLGDMWDSTVTRTDGQGTLSLARLAEPRLEPEIVLGLRAAPNPSAGPEALADAVEWIAIGCEVVQSVFPGWVFTAAETVAAGGLHGRLLVGAPVPRGAPAFASLIATLPGVELVVERDGVEIARGAGANALDGPLSALANAVATLARHPEHPPLGAGEVVTTGTVADAYPLSPGEAWTIRSVGDVLPPLTVRTTA
jgi:2-oxo-3-hexenedioate decarboxylase